jgi:cytochrome b pre-mRNA-processing protein 3
MDLSLREMGAGDIGVSKRVRVRAEAFMGRLDAYATALDNNDREALAAAIGRNLLRDSGSASGPLVDHVLALDARLSALKDDVLLAGNLG